MNINKSNPVMVTGSNGYVGSWIVKRLLESGITVHAAVRNPDNPDKVGHLKKIAQSTGGNLKLFKADLMEARAYSDAMQTCEVVFHTASPFKISVDDPQKELVDPAKIGTRNVLNTVNAVPSVKRVVLTSSCAAIYGDAIDCQKAPNGELTEDNWNTTSSLTHRAYSYSKTVAEREAWAIADKQNRWDLVTINPSFILGPPLNMQDKSSESFNFIKQLGDGTFKGGIPDIGMGMVDVRDVAEAHFQAAYTPSAKGRYLTSANNGSFFIYAQQLLPKYGESYPIPKKALPKPIVWLIGPLLNKSVTRKFIWRNVNVKWKANNSKIKQELGIKFKSMKQTMEDGFGALIDNNIF